MRSNSLAVQKSDADKTRAKGITGCTLHELCNEDKAKVAKLLRQVSSKQPSQFPKPQVKVIYLTRAHAGGRP